MKQIQCDDNYKLIDLLKFLCAYLVIGIHTRPFQSISILLDKVFYYNVSNYAVPFFYAGTCYFLIIKRKRSIASTYPSYPNFAIITSTSWKIRTKNPNIREVDYGNTTCYSGKAVRDLDCDYSGMQEQRYENKGLAC